MSNYTSIEMKDNLREKYRTSSKILSNFANVRSPVSW